MPDLTCPICKRPAASEYRPFCSRRCADVDLGRWLTGAYAIPASDDEPDDTDEAPNGDSSSPR
jgi:uncharacterized protein